MTEAVKKQLAKPKHRYSNLFLTLNTNKHFGHADEPGCRELEEKLCQAMNKMFGNIDSFIDNYVIFLQAKDGSTPRKEAIRSCSFDGACELGGDRGMLHAHILFRCYHVAYIRYDFAKMNKFFQEELGIGPIHMHNKVFGSSNSNIIDYINKNVRA